MKKTGLFVLMLLILTWLNGCSFEIGSYGNNSSHEMSGSYYKLNGVKEKDITLEDGESIEILVDIVTKEGSIDVYIIDDDNNYTYEGHDLQTSDFTVTLSEAGEYTIKVDAKDHKGSYSFTWE